MTADRVEVAALPAVLVARGRKAVVPQFEFGRFAMT